MPTLDHGSFGKETQEFSGEEGATTGRIRDVGFPDWVYARFSSMINDVDEIILTRGDCVQNVEIKVCTAYDVNGEIIEEVPLNLNGVKPVYSDKSYEWHLWDGPRDLSDAQKVDKILRPKRMEYVKAGGAGIPAGLREYVKDFEKFVRRPVSYISIGPTRGESIKL